MARTEWTDREKGSALAALAANGGNVSKTARQLEIPRTTLRLWARGLRQNADVAEIGRQKKSTLADEFERVAEQMVAETLGMEHDPKESRYTKMMCAAIAVDKMRLLREQATSIGGKTPELTDDEIEREINRIYAARGKTGALRA